MKKKLIIFVSLIICSLALLLALPACDNTAGSLQYDKKYIAEGHANNDKERYYLFHSDGTGIYKYFSSGYTYAYDYTVSFKYTYADEDKTAVVCLFDSVEYGSKDTEKSVSTDWSELLTVSKNVLCTTNGYFYINEDYLKEIPNFNS